MEKISKNKNKIVYRTQRSKTISSMKISSKKLTENQLALEDTKKYYQKFYESPNTVLISQIKSEKLNIFLSNYKFNDINILNRILSKYFFYKDIIISPYDPKSNRNISLSKKNTRELLTEGEKVKKAKEKRDQELEAYHMTAKLGLGIYKHLSLTTNLKTLKLLNFNFDVKFAESISKGIIENNTIHNFTINNSKMDIESYEILLKGLLNHEKIEYFDLQNNNLDDKYGNMIGRIIARQTYRRDQEIWLYGLRNEIPINNDYTLGLISINLNGNKLSSHTADYLCNPLAQDQYIRELILSNNLFNNQDCKKFIYMLRRNMILLNINLRNNPGYDDNIHLRITTKMTKNIKNLYSQYKNNVYNAKELEYYKKFIDISFFNINIPENILEYYNKNLKYKNPIGNQTMYKEMKKTFKNEEKKNSSKKEKKINLKLSNLGEEEKLIEENLMLKKQILELKAENVQNKMGKKLKIPKKLETEALKKNFKLANELFDKLDNIMDTMGNDKKKFKK